MNNFLSKPNLFGELPFISFTFSESLINFGTGIGNLITLGSGYLGSNGLVCLLDLFFSHFGLDFSISSLVKLKETLLV